jgi:hypothetical protein
MYSWTNLVVVSIHTNTASMMIAMKHEMLKGFMKVLKGALKKLHVTVLRS